MAGKLLTYVLFILIPIVAIIVYISILNRFSVECKTEITGPKLSVLGSLKNCINLCWSKHDFGQDIFSDDCFIVSINSTSMITKTDMENFFENMTKTYFDFIEPNKAYKLKIRYNSTGKEVSLILLEI
jgi:hypothetical protein